MLLPRDSSDLQRQTQTQSKGVENDITSKWLPKKNGYGHADFTQNRFGAKYTEKIQKRSLYNDKGVNTSRRHTNCKYIQPQHLSWGCIYLLSNIKRP